MIMLVLVVLGLCAGSFVNALVWRIHEQAKSKKSTSKDLSILTGRSLCPSCHHELAWYDLVPVISWLVLNGKCRYCHKPIARQYPVVELATASLFVFSYHYWPSTITGHLEVFSFVAWLLLLTGLLALFVYDLKWMLLPDRIVYPLMWLAVSAVIIEAFFKPGSEVAYHFYSAFWAVAVGGGLFYGLFQVSKGKWIGGGDVKLGALLGLIVGSPLQAGLVILLASLSGSVLTVPLLLTGKINKTTRLPFGPLLIMAVIITKLFGASIIHWYTRRVLLI